MKSIVATFLILTSLTSFAEKLEVIATGSSSQIQALRKSRGVLSVRKVFSHTEKQALQSNNHYSFLNAQILTLQNEQVFKRMQNQIQAQKLKVSLDLRQIEGRISSDLDLSSLQWALNNKGIAQSVDLDPMVYYKVQARVGEDLNVKSAASFNAKVKILVAVLDTGVQKDHPALSQVLHRNESECVALEKFLACTKTSQRADCEKTWMDPKNPEVDQDRNGFPLDCQGWSLLSGTNAVGITGGPDFIDQHGHGTHVSGIIAAKANKTTDFAGVSQNIEILPVQVIGGGPNEPIKPMSVEMDPHEDKLARPKKQSFLADMVARGVIYAMNSGAQVINFSMGWPENQDSAFIRQVIQAAQAKGIVIVAAAGNDSTRALLKPCAYSGVVCVGASGPDGAIAHYSNYGSGVDLIAPGTNILSTYPQDKRPIRMRQTMGYEFLTGTSQSTPYVTGIIAELLARGYSAQEAIARLILSARSSQRPLELIAGTPHSPEKGNSNLLRSAVDQKKFSLSGNVDFVKALNVAVQPLFVPATKEKSEIKWNRRDDVLTYKFSIKNLWQSIAAENIKVSVEMIKDKDESIRPEVSAVMPASLQGVWATGEVKEFQVQLKITDDIPEKSKIPSELSFAVSVDSGTNVRRFVLDAEIIATIDLQNLDRNSAVYPILGMPQERTDFIPVDENLDGVFRQDYALGSYSATEWKFWMMRQNQDGAYQVGSVAKIPAVNQNADQARTSFLRADVNQDGRSEYILTVYDDKSGEKEQTPSPESFYFFDDHLKLIEHFQYDSRKSQIPYSDSIKWMKISGKLRPVWLGPGLDPAKVRDPWDIWNDPEEQNEVPMLRLYFLNAQNQLQAIQTHQGYELIDILEPTVAQKRQGHVPVLLAKNRGTESLPSYIYDFAVAEFFDGQVQNFQKLDLFSGEQVYRNLLDTRVGQVLSLDYEDEVAKGTFWFSEGKMKEQRLSVLLNDVQYFTNTSLAALRDKVDAALWVRTVFAGTSINSQSGAFVLTNSEIQYHDLRSGDVVNKSMERYSFFPSSMMTNLQYPLVVNDLSAKTKLPALFTTESSGLSRGVKVTIPHYVNGKLIELNAPARLRLRAESGCKPMENPIWGGKVSAAALDYYCGDRSGQKMIRVQLNY